ncbi:hypothetical protein ACQ33O_09535 [Ferruginibacter sp. SUN002]|uniref:hypothetical protein n=1 Tax=Ferruginibacter sp. SUN002 TaxID=2937789 RepID=UPI003D3634A5
MSIKHYFSALAFITFSLTSYAQDVWCKALKAIPQKIAKDEKAVVGKKVWGNEYYETFLSKETISGSDSVRVKKFPDGGRLYQVVAFYCSKSTDAQANAKYKELSGKLKSCFKNTVEMDHAYEAGYEKAHSYVGDGYIIRIVKYSASTYELNKDQLTRVAVIIEY